MAKIYDIERLKEIYFNQLEYLKAQEKYQKAKKNSKIPSKILSELENIVIQKGLKMLDIEHMNYSVKEFGKKYNISKIKKMLLDNKFYNLYFHGDKQSYFDLDDYSAISLFENQHINSYFGNMKMAERLLFRFTNKKRPDNKPTTIDYFIEQLKKHTGKDYKILHFNDCIKDKYFDHDYIDLYFQGLLIPNDLMNEFCNIKSVKSIDKFIEAHNEVVVIDDIRLECVDLGSMLVPHYYIGDEFAFDLDYHKGNSRFKMVDKIVKLPREEVMNAVFDTLEYRKQFVKKDHLNTQNFFSSRVDHELDYDPSEFEFTL